MGRGEPGGGKERELRRQRVPSFAERWVERQTRCLVSSLLARQRPFCVAIFNPAGASARRRESGVCFNEERNKP